MKYQLQLDAEAADKLNGLPEGVRDDVINELLRLAGNPVALGRKAPFPHSPKYQLFPFAVDDGDRKWRFHALFHFMPGESAIKISALVVFPPPTLDFFDEPW